MEVVGIVLTESELELLLSALSSLEDDLGDLGQSQSENVNTTLVNRDLIQVRDLQDKITIGLANIDKERNAEN
jgi:hypothetical protein